MVRLLADGDYHSGEAIARVLGISRAAVCKALHRLSLDLGLPVESRHGRGYRLAAPLELLDAGSILGVLAELSQEGVARLEIHDRIDSTNGRLMAEGSAGAPSGTVCLAERQTAGRGRRGHPWISPFGANLYLSILWRYRLAPAALGGVSLAAGVAVAQVLRHCGVREVGLKWPNDLLWRRCKLGGLLLEVTGEAQGPSFLVVGLGLNLRMDEDQGSTIDQPWADLNQALDGALPSRNRLAAMLIDALVKVLADFANTGLAPFLPDWEGFDLLRGEPVWLHLGDGIIAGEHAGIGPDGSLRLRTPEGIRHFQAGEVSLRPPGHPDTIPADPGSE
jgi:BirA family biotin operon repressor/biotin-[acetyl-CoA-carboxylase] ligase